MKSKHQTENLFDWDEENLAHIADHHVSAGEVKYALLNFPVQLEYQDWHVMEDRFQEVGRTAAGRFLVVV